MFLCWRFSHRSMTVRSMSRARAEAMIKATEKADGRSCWNRAENNEMVFVLLGRDVAAPEAIRAWIRERIKLGKNKPDDPPDRRSVEMCCIHRVASETCMKVVSLSDFNENATDAKPWPGAHPDIRFIVLRRLSETDTHEADRCVGYLKKNSNLLVDWEGNELGGTPQVGDFIDTLDSFRQLGYDSIIRRANAEKSQPANEPAEERQKQKDETSA